jgi:hypothetical protein
MLTNEYQKRKREDVHDWMRVSALLADTTVFASPSLHRLR